MNPPLRVYYVDPYRGRHPALCLRMLTLPFPPLVALLDVKVASGVARHVEKVVTDGTDGPHEPRNYCRS